MLLLLIAASALAEPTVFRGPEVVQAVGVSTDVQDSMLQLLQTHGRHDRLLSFFGTTVRWAPGEFEMNDGDRRDGNLGRYLVGAGVGLGNSSKGGAFAGLFMDGVQATGVPEFGYGGYQQMLYVGGAYRHFQLTLAGTIDFIQGGTAGGSMDPWNRFAGKGYPDMYRDAIDVGIRPYDPGGTTWTMYEDRTGAFAAIRYQGDTIYDLRLNLQPLKQLLPEAFGLPAAGLRSLDERAATLYPQTTPPPGQDLEPVQRRWQTELGTDDALGVGVRVRWVQQWAPVPTFRYAEIGVVRTLGETDAAPVGGGLRGIVARPDDSFIVAAEAFAMVGLWKTERSTSGFGSHFALSYSYNTPDTSTYLPIPNAHVVGLQFVIGEPETSRPLIPIVRGLDADE